MVDYPRHQILGTIEHEQFLDEAYYCGWISSPSMWEILKQKVCQHDYTIWCTNKGVPDCRKLRYRFCNKCCLEQREAE